MVNTLGVIRPIRFGLTVLRQFIYPSPSQFRQLTKGSIVIIRRNLA